MKTKLLIVFLFLFSLSSIAQVSVDVIDKTKYKVYLNDTIYSSHSTMGNAIESLANIKFRNPDANTYLTSEGNIEVSISGVPTSPDCPDPEPCPECPDPEPCPECPDCPDGNGDSTITTEILEVEGQVLRNWNSLEPIKKTALLTTDKELLNIDTDSLFYATGFGRNIYLNVKKTYKGGDLIKVERVSPLPKQIKSLWTKKEQSTATSARLNWGTNGRVKITYRWGKDPDNPENIIPTNNRFYGSTRDGRFYGFSKTFKDLEPDSYYYVYVDVEFEDGTKRTSSRITLRTLPEETSP